MDGIIGNERAPLSNSKECDFGLYYVRSSSFLSFNTIPSSNLTSILREEDMCKDHGNSFNAKVLKKVDTEHKGGERYPVDTEFYPALHKLLREQKRNHKTRNICNGCLNGFWKTSISSSNSTRYIYHGLGEAGSDPPYPSEANLAKLFPCVYTRRPNSDCRGDFLTLVSYAGLGTTKLLLPKVRYIFRDGRYVSIRVGNFCEDSGGLLANRAQVFQSLTVLHSIIDIYKLNTVEISWLSSKIKEVFSTAEIIAKAKEMVDDEHVKTSSEQTHSSKIASIKNDLNRLRRRWSSLKRTWLKLNFQGSKNWKRKKTILGN
ncbi:hypothetical protein Cgig2_010007 [Carnegiea gigantea]|uniref:Uncharacterized protein n=1 Tax=Carnegiea gigantea TaxID=171969 RepID=A0A9Q1JQI8_9CARY|nr:hypothetical protein Cgig2_010007 [Carnegiea gigantea]